MESLLLTARESIRYRGRGGHYSWLAHRISGLAILSFLVVHVWEGAMANYSPAIYTATTTFFKHPILGIGEVALMGAVLFHAFNGIRITILDFKPELWRLQRQSVTFVWGLFLILYIPIAIYMFLSIVNHCNEAAAIGSTCWTFTGV